MKLLFKFVFLIFLFLVISLKFVSAFGVGIPYSAQDPLKLYSGQSSDIAISLQSSISEGNLTIVPEISEGQDIVKITDSSKEYNVIANQPVGAAVHLKVSIPDNAAIGKEYIVKLIFRDVTKKEGGMVGLSTSIGASFKVLVVEKPAGLAEAKPSRIIEIIWIGFIIILIIGIIIILYFMIKRRK